MACFSDNCASVPSLKTHHAQGQSMTINMSLGDQPEVTDLRGPIRKSQFRNVFCSLLGFINVLPHYFITHHCFIRFARNKFANLILLTHDQRTRSELSQAIPQKVNVVGVGPGISPNFFASTLWVADPHLQIVLQTPSLSRLHEFSYNT